MRKIAAACLPALLAGCAALPPPQGVDYVCAQGGGFRLWEGGDVAVIEIGGMRFELQPEAAADGTERLSCSMLRLTRRDGRARLELEGSRHLEDCRPRP